MDSKVKRIVILLTSLTILAVLMIVVAANRLDARRQPAKTSVSKEDTSASVSAPFKLDLNAWRTDADFFDKTDYTLTGRIMEEMKTLVVYAVSVEHDLRIRILDYEGNPSVGNTFELELKPMGASAVSKPLSVTDEDKDGIVVVKDLEPGDYEVTLLPITGLNVPDRALKVKVKDSLEYKLIEDIALDIKHEADVDSAKEDLMEISAFDSEGTNLKTSPIKDMVVGIDISSEDGEVDFVKLYDAGIRFVILRAGYRGAENGEIIADDMFAANAKAAIRSGMDVGAYFFSQAVSEREAVEEASALIVMCSGATITYPLCIREDRAGGRSRGDEIDEKRRTDFADAFCKTIKNAGYVPMVYASGAWLSTNLEASRLEKYKIWLADYAQAPRYEGFYDMWQYCGAGKVPGFDHHVGLTISYMKESE